MSSATRNRPLDQNKSEGVKKCGIMGVQCLRCVTQAKMFWVLVTLTDFLLSHSGVSSDVFLEVLATGDKMKQTVTFSQFRMTLGLNNAQTWGNVSTQLNKTSNKSFYSL